MTPSEILRNEAEEITHRTGRYIPPYRVASLTRAAHKVVELLTKTDVCTTYEEILIVLDIVRSTICKATGKEE